VVDAHLCVAAVREGASEPGIIVERVVDFVRAGRGRLRWPAGVVGDMDVVRRVGSARRGGPAGRGGEGGRAGGDGATVCEGRGGPPARMCWMALAGGWSSALGKGRGWGRLMMRTNGQ